MPTAKLRIDGLRGSADETRLEKSVRAVAGVYGAVASHSDHCLEVDFADDVTGLGEIMEAAGAAGFEASPAS